MCSLQAAAGGSPEDGSAGAAGKPQTRIRQRPGHRTTDRTPTFRFASSIAGSTYLCRLDSHSFKRCRSPFIAPRLRPGHHVFKVKARTPDGATDRSPAVYWFTVIAPKQVKRP